MAALIPWLKTIHITALIVWSAGLFALPAIYAAYPGLDHPRAMRRLRATARFTFIAIASPAAVITIIAGTLLIHPTGSYAGWLVVKLMAVALMVLFHVACGRIVVLLHHRPDLWAARTHHTLLLFPILLIAAVLYLVLAKPF